MEIVSTITKAITDLFTGVGSGLVTLFETMFKGGSEGTMTTVAIVGLTMLGVGIGLGFLRFIFRKVAR